MHPVFFKKNVLTFLMEAKINLFKYDEHLDFLFSRKCEWEVANNCRINKFEREKLKLKDAFLGLTVL